MPTGAARAGSVEGLAEDVLAYRLAKVVPGSELFDETPVGELVVRVSHLLQPIGGGRVRITYPAEIDGPEDQAKEIGPAITSDFPETISSDWRNTAHASATPPWNAVWRAGAKPWVSALAPPSRGSDESVWRSSRMT
jgi:hypothetical protein